MSEIIVEALVITPFAQNCRLLVNKTLKQGVVFDPGGESARLWSAMAGYDVNSWTILLTHSHIDHAGGVSPLLKRLATSRLATSPALFGHKAEVDFRSSLKEQSSYFGLDIESDFGCPEPDVYCSGGEILELAGLEIRVLFTPGHSPGHLSFLVVSPEQGIELVGEQEAGTIPAGGEVLFAGDAIFQDSIGRTDLPGGSYETLIASIREQILTLNDSTVLLCGHGPNSTVGRERSSNPFLRD